MNGAELPHPAFWSNLTVLLNAASVVLLSAGYAAIRRGNRDRHRRLMLGAVATSALFLAAYVCHHALHGSTRYPYHDWTRTLYLLILVPHTVLAMVILPFILRGLWLALRGNFDRHAPLMRRVWPVWLYVSLSGVAVYLMLYVYPLIRG